jgi:hypothetical protein
MTICKNIEQFWIITMAHLMKGVQYMIIPLYKVKYIKTTMYSMVMGHGK